MRKFYMLLTIVLFSTFSKAQVLLSEGFEGGTFPPTGWTRINDGIGNNWQSSKLATFTDGPYAAAFGTGCMVYEYDLNNPADAWMITPSIAMTTGNNYVIKFWYRVRLNTFPEKLKVTIGSAATTISQTTTLWNNNGGASLTNASYTLATINHTPTSNGNYFIGFNCYSDENQWALSVDSVSVELVNPCSGNPPSITSVASTYNLCTSGTSVLSLPNLPAITGLTYQWESSPSDANTFTNVSGGTGSTSTSYTTSTLNSSTDFRCKVTCSNGGGFSYSTISKVVVSNGVPANDLVCNATPLTLNGAVINANTICATATGDPAFANSTPNNTIWYSYTPTVTGVYNVEMTRPAGLNGGFLNGWLGIYTATGACPSLTLAEVPSSLSFNLTTGTSFILVTPSLTAGTTYYFMIDGVNGANGNFGIKLLNAPQAPSCVTNISPISGATAITAPIATISWNTSATATAYDIYFGTANPPTVNIGTTTNTSVNISGLTINTTYYWYVVPRNNGGPAAGCVSNLTSFTTDGVLPVTLVSFTGKKEGNNNILS
ncbi:MAG: choice-of-anchor J domain-containing protein, partial [Chitinophagaceae bacterium]